MKKLRLTALLLCLAFCLTLPALAAEDEPTRIASVDDLSLLRQYSYGSFVLAADLDMSGVDWEPLPFSGTLDGAGHTIYNLSVNRPGAERLNTFDGNDRAYPTALAGLFSSLTDAQVRNLNLLGVDVDIDTAEHCFAAPLAGYMKNTLVENCAVSDARVYLTLRCQEGLPAAAISNDRSDRCIGGVGGLAGFGSGTVNDSRSESVLVFTDETAAKVKCEQFLGGILACGNVFINNCQVVIDGYDACRGYVHNGGLVGMFYRYDAADPLGTIAGCTVDGAIAFFEDNTNRRAYCQAFVGELLTWTSVDGVPNFEVRETTDYSALLRPEKCAQPQLTEETYAENCQWGYTTHTCAVCGNRWRDSFTAPIHSPGEWETVEEATLETAGLRRQSCTLCGTVLAEEVIAPHIPGEWVTVREAGYGQPGLRQRLCLDCGEVLAEETIPALTAVSQIVLEPTSLEMMYGETYPLAVQVLPADAESTILYWDTSDRRIAAIDANGTVRATGRGTAVIQCVSADGFASAECTVTVRYTARQWLVHYVLFGWLWDR